MTIEEAVKKIYELEERVQRLENKSQTHLELPVLTPSATLEDTKRVVNWIVSTIKEDTIHGQRI